MAATRQDSRSVVDGPCIEGHSGTQPEGRREGRQAGGQAGKQAEQGWGLTLSREA